MKYRIFYIKTQRVLKLKILKLEYRATVFMLYLNEAFTAEYWWKLSENIGKEQNDAHPISAF